MRRKLSKIAALVLIFFTTTTFLVTTFTQNQILREGIKIVGEAVAGEIVGFVLETLTGIRIGEDSGLLTQLKDGKCSNTPGNTCIRLLAQNKSVVKLYSSQKILKLVAIKGETNISFYENQMEISVTGGSLEVEFLVDTDPPTPSPVLVGKQITADTNSGSSSAHADVLAAHPTAVAPPGFKYFEDTDVEGLNLTTIYPENWNITKDSKNKVRFSPIEGPYWYEIYRLVDFPNQDLRQTNEYWIQKLTELHPGLKRYSINFNIPEFSLHTWIGTSLGTNQTAIGTYITLHNEKVYAIQEATPDDPSGSEYSNQYKLYYEKMNNSINLH